MKQGTALLKDRIKRLEKKNKMLTKVLLQPVKVYVANMNWLGIGRLVLSVDADGIPIEIYRQAYQPGRFGI